MGLLTKIFGNRDDQETTAEEAPDVDRETVELEPYQLSAGDEAGAPEQSGRLTVAPPEEAPTPPEKSGRSSAGSRRKRRRPIVAAHDVSEELPHELTRRRIARPSAATVEAPPAPPPIPAVASEADDPEEIDVSDQLDEVGEVDVDLDASSDLIIEDDEPSRVDEDEEVTSTSVSLGAAGEAASPPANPTAVGESSLAQTTPAASSLAPTPAALDSGTQATIQLDSERARMATQTKFPKQTLLEVGTSFKGTLKSTCPVVVCGTIDGEIDVPLLSVGSTGAVFGIVRAETLRSQGTLAGQVDASEVYLSGTVRSKTIIRAKRLEFQIVAAENGRLQLTFGGSELEPTQVASSPTPAVLEA